MPRNPPYIGQLLSSFLTVCRPAPAGAIAQAACKCRPDSPYDDQLEAITSTAKQAASSIQDTADNVRTAAGRTGSQAAQSLHTLSSRAGVETEQTTSAAQDSATDVITSAASRLGAIVPQVCCPAGCSLPCLQQLQPLAFESSCTMHGTI